MRLGRSLASDFAGTYGRFGAGTNCEIHVAGSLHMYPACKPLALVGLICTLTACGAVNSRAATAVDPPKVNTQAATLQDFQARVNAYLALRKQAAGKSPPPKQSDDTAKIKAAQETFAATLQSMRKNAKAGDIFTPETRAKFRQLMYPELKGPEGRETKAELKEDAPASVPLKVNAKYPEGAALPTVPPNLLASLPVLPKELEYRIIDRHLILRDVDANIIVDYIPNAIR
jgi:hypothetical protein